MFEPKNVRTKKKFAISNPIKIKPVVNKKKQPDCDARLRRVVFFLMTSHPIRNSENVMNEIASPLNLARLRSDPC